MQKIGKKRKNETIVSTPPKVNTSIQLKSPQKNTNTNNNNNNNTKSPSKKTVTFKNDEEINEEKNQDLNRRKSLNSLQFLKTKHQISEDELAKIYSATIKLSTENKINQKNTWDLNLIDHIDDIILEKSGAGYDQFTKASATLDASVKIYTSRVDSVHNEMYKVLGGLTRSEKTKEEENRPSQEDEEEKDKSLDDDNELEKKQKKKQKRYTSGQTIEKNPENLNMKSIELSLGEIDPLLKKNAVNFTEGGAHSLLLNCLSAFNNCQLSFDSTNSFKNIEKNEKNLKKKIPFESLKSMIPNTEKLKICPTFSNFEFNLDKSSHIDDIEIVAEFSSDDEDMEPINNLFNESQNIFDFGGGFDNDNENDLAEEKETQMLEELMNNDEDDEIDEDNPFRKEIQHQKKEPSNQGLILEDNEFAYLNPDFFFLKNWNGSHWKFNTKVKPNYLNTDQDENKSKKKQRDKEPFYVDFSSPSKPKFKPVNSKLTTLSNSAQKPQPKSKTMLPDIQNYDARKLVTLFNKPDWSLNSVRKNIPIHIQNEISEKEKNEENFEENDHFEIFEGGDFEPQNTTVDEDNNEFLHIPQIKDQDHILNTPQQVSILNLNYAKTAKFVDVKALKDKIWNNLSIEKKSNNNQKSKKEMINSQHFSKLVDFLNPKDSNDESVSVPYAFICLLHLANEKGLDILQETEDLNILPPKE